MASQQGNTVSQISLGDNYFILSSTRQCVVRPKKPVCQTVNVLIGRKRTLFSHLCNLVMSYLIGNKGAGEMPTRQWTLHMNRGYVLLHNTTTCMKNDQNNISRMPIFCLIVNDYLKFHTNVWVANVAQAITLHLNYKRSCSSQILCNTCKNNLSLWWSFHN